MTSASGLFDHSWRSRAGRASASPDPPAPCDDPDLRRPRRLRRRPGAREPSFSGPHEPRLRAARTVQENESVLSDLGDARFRIGDSSIGRMRLNRHDQLPSSVLQARARLLERLGALSLTRPRNTTTASRISSDEFSVGDDFEFIDNGNLEIDNPNRAPPIRNVYKKPPGLSWDAIAVLRKEIFTASENDDKVSRASMECCICLELFRQGEGLVQLQCTHRFHGPCLEPWVLACGDCPYCRARI